MKGKKNKMMIWTGLLLIAAALLLVLYNMYEGFRAGRLASQMTEKLEESIFTGEKAKEGTEVPEYMWNPDMEMPVKIIDGTEYVGVLCIPSLDLVLPVISKWSDSNLKIAPCRYEGSAYKDNLIIAGHNYAAHFGRLGNIREGDTVIFTDMDGNVFTYKMAEWEILKPADIEGMERGDWDLTLFTCTLGGKSRITIRFKREKL
ncbi:sortase [Sporofaciens sp. SGI.106]|uniref:sortase n=1 Tax=Sporofaciens sp. SGI.106 TaxID=3420568 RepID=UPI003D083824